MPQGELKAVMEALKADLAAGLPGRTVSRSYRPMAQHSDAALQAGVVCVVSMGEEGYANWRGREADLGSVDVAVLGQLCVLEHEAPEALEDAELRLAEEIKAVLASDVWTAPVRACVSSGFRQSGQLEFPYGWVVFRVEVRT